MGILSLPGETETWEEPESDSTRIGHGGKHRARPWEPDFTSPGVLDTLSRMSRHTTRLSHLFRMVWLSILLSGPALYPALSQPIERIGHDAGVEHIYRGFLFSSAISDGVVFPRWVQELHLGLGGPLFTFQAPWPFYGMDLLYRLGVPHPLGWRLLMAGGIFAAFIGMFLLVREITRQHWPALVAATTFIYAPYVIHNIFDRGSNEAYSMLLYPWVLWSLLWLARRPTAPGLVLAGSIWAACIGFHVLAPLILAPVAGLMALGLGWRYRTPAPVLALLAGGMLTAFIWAPIVDEMHYVKLDQIQYIPEAQPANHPVPLDRLLAPPAIYDVLRGNNRVTDQAGWLHVLALALGVPATIGAWRQRKHELALFSASFTLIGLLLLWLLTAQATPVWHLLEPVLGMLEYRIRLMGLLSLAAALLAGCLVALYPLRAQRYLAPGFIGVLLLVTIPSLYVGLLPVHGHFGTRLTIDEVREAEVRYEGKGFTAFGETIPRWRELPLTPETAWSVRASPVASPQDDVRLLGSVIRTSQWDLALESPGATTLTLHLLYYPRWQAFLDGQPVALHPEPETGLAQLALPAGRHELAIRYELTAAERAGLLTSGLVGLLLLIVVLRGISGAGKTVREGTGFSFAASLSPPLWLLALLTLGLCVKILYIDPHTTWFRCATTATDVCGAAATTNVPFAGSAALRGYTVEAQEVSPGGEVRGQLFWQAGAEIRYQYHRFVHVRNNSPDWPLNPATGTDIWAQENTHVPGARPTDEYVPGLVYLDEFRIAVPQDMPLGEYRLEIGWYDPVGGDQLEPDETAVHPPLQVFWRSLLLPPITVR
jgi:hypothetical protein